MRLSKLGMVVTVLGAVSCQQSEGRPLRPEGEGIVGTWRALEYVKPYAMDSAGRWPLGKSMHGYLVYDATGHVFFQVASGLAATPEARGRWRAADSASLQELLASASAYFGTYVVNSGSGSVIHRIEGELPPNGGSTEIATPYRVHGDTLVLGRDSSAHWTFLRVKR